MNLHQLDLSELVLASFQRACSDDRLAVAEHLLLALEELSADPVGDAGLESDSHLARAYGIIAERASALPSSSNCRPSQGH